MWFRKNNLRFVDTLQFFQSPLADLSDTYNIDTIKGHFPHLFNTRENQNYIGKIPAEDAFGVKNMSKDKYHYIEYESDGETVKKESGFLPWYKSQENRTDWNFREEMIKYCRADVELLSKAVLKFRQMFKQDLDVDPFRYVTLASLCMSVYRGKFLPDETIVANEQNKKVSQLCKEWLIHLNDKHLLTEYPLVIDTSKYMSDNAPDIDIDGDSDDETVSTDCPTSDLTSDTSSCASSSSCISSPPPPICKPPPSAAASSRDEVPPPPTPPKNYYKRPRTVLIPDAINKKMKIIKEFYGCYFHGCPKCHPELNEKYNKTLQREDILRGEGYSIETMWECQWLEMKRNLSNREDIETQAKAQNIKTRDALYGGRTECFKRYVKCTDKQKIFYFDVVSLYPTVNSLDDYAVGFKKYVNVHPNDILNDKFIGLVKCDVIPPKDLYKPVLPDNSDGKLLFHLKPLLEKFTRQ